MPSGTIGVIAYIELLRNYDAKCAILSVMPFEAIKIYSKSLKNQTTENFYKGAKILSDDILDCVKRGEKMIAIPFNFKTANSGHANMLIYRPDKKTIERIEPHGQKFKLGKDNQDDIINEVLKTMFEKKMKPYLKKYTPKYIPPNEICPYEKSFQALENEIEKLENEGGGYCNLWSIFLLEIIFLNPNLTTGEVLKKALDITKQDPQYIKNLIRGYVKKTEKVVDTYIKRIDKTDGFSYEDEVKKKTNIMSKKDIIMDDLIKYYFNIGSKNSQIESVERRKEIQMNLENLRKKYNYLYRKLYMYDMEELYNLLKNVFNYKGNEMVYKNTDYDDSYITYILYQVEKNNKKEMEIYKYFNKLEKKKNIN